MKPTVDISHPRPGVALLTLARPERMNALDPATDQAMAAALAAIEADASIHCVVLTGAGKTFCVGADIPTLLPQIRANIAAGRDDPQLGGLTHTQVTGKPVIAAVNGLALGGGLEIALACDLRIASTNARFGLPEIRLGVLAGAGGCTRLPRMIGQALAAEMILTGEPIGAQRALEAGLVSRVVEPEQLLPVALDLAAQLAARAPQALRACTALLRRARFDEWREALEDERAAFAALLSTADADEGIRAFVEKRQPVFQGAAGPADI